MHESFCARRTAFLPSLCLAGICLAGISLADSAFGQDPALPPAEVVAVPAAPSDTAPGVDAAPSSAGSEQEFQAGFDGGMRLGIGMPLGSAGRGALGESRKVGDLAPWRAPVWVDINYRLSPVASYGLYAQIGIDGAGDACAGTCTGSDLRIGAQGQWRLSPGADVDPWLGLGLGYESLSVQTFEVREDADGLFGVRTTELLGGPELLLQGGLELRVEDSLQLGPFISASIGSYLLDSYKCRSEVLVECPGGSSIDGSGFHAWIGIGLNGRYSP